MNPLGTQEKLVSIQIMGAIMGMVDSAPAYRISPEALAKALNMRIDRMELGTSPGRVKHNVTAMHGTADEDGIAWGVRTDGTEDLIVATDGGYWRVVGDTKTLLSKVSGASTLSLISATKVSGSTGTKWTARVSAGDQVWLDGDGMTAAAVVSAVVSDSELLLVSAYPKISAGTLDYTIWDKQATGKTRIRMFMNRWLFANATQRPTEYDPTTSAFREVGLPSAAGVSATLATGGDTMPGARTYSYKVCWRDTREREGMPSVSMSYEITAASGGIVLTWPTLRAEVTRVDIYRVSAGSSVFNYLASATATEGGGSWQDSSLDSALNTTILPPTQNYQPPIGAEDFLIHRDRVIWFKGPRAYVGGLDPLNAHAGAFAGRYQPEYQPSRQWWLGRDKGEQAAIAGAFEFGGRVYALRSRSLWMLNSTPDTPNTWGWREVLSNVGCESRWTVALDGEVVYWLGRRAGRLTIVRYDGFARFLTQMQGSLDTIISASEAAGGCSNGYYRLSFSGSNGDRELEWNTDRGDGKGAWAIRDWRHLCYADAEGVPYAGGAGGFVYQLDVGRQDAGASITRQVDSSAPAVQWEYPVHWRFMQLEIESETAIAAISTYLKMDGGSWTHLSGLNLSAAAASAWIQRQQLPNWCYGRRPQLRLKSTASTEDYRIRGAMLKGEVDIRESI